MTNPSLTYWYSQQNWGNDQDLLSVYYRPSALSEWQLLAEYTSAVTTWTMDSILLPNPSATYQIAFVGLSDFGYGITLDDITITDASIAPEITDPTVATTAATNVTETGATLNGIITNPDNVIITAKGFEWKATSGGTYAPVTVSNDNLTYNLTGLTPNTSYTYKAFITFNDTTVYGQEMTFTTLEEVIEPCDVPTGLVVLATTHESISLSWNPNPNVSNWTVKYQPQGGSASTVTATTNSYTITGLIPQTTYEIQVQANCNSGQTSDWSIMVTGNTGVGIDEHLLNSISLYPNPAKEVVNVQCTMNNVQVESIEVFDVYGKVVRTGVETFHETSLQTAQINVSGLAAGMYFVRVTTDQGAVTKSFVKK
jgi:chitodextrinase